MKYSGNKKTHGAAVILFMAFLFPKIAAATIVTGNFTGTINSGEDVSNYLGFGSEWGDLDGLTIEGTITYDTTLAPDNQSENSLIGNFTSNTEVPNWLTINQVTIGGNPVPMPAVPNPVLSSYFERRIELKADTETFGILHDYNYDGDEEYAGYQVEQYVTGGEQAFPELSIPLFLDFADFSYGEGEVNITDDAAGIHIEAA